MDLGLTGKVALVTGVSQGIGLACAESLLGEGALVAGTSRSAPPAIDGLTHLEIDMLEADAGERAVAATVERLGGLDILVNNVGGATIRTGFDDQSDDEWSDVLALNLTTAVRATRAALPHLVERGGVVINVSSVNGIRPSPSIYAYSAAKAAMDNFTVGLSREFAPRGVRVVGVAPGPVGTPLWLEPGGAAATIAAQEGSDPQSVVDEVSATIPVGRFTTAEEIGDLVAFLASSRAGTITGTTIRVDGGSTPTV